MTDIFKNYNGNLENNVLQFLKEASDIKGYYEKINFFEYTDNELSQYEIVSPIERIFYISFKLQCGLYYKELHVWPGYALGDRHHHSVQGCNGIYIYPQKIIGKYKVDFLISNCTSYGFEATENPMDIIIELDGHDFHDKDKKQRAYENERNRFLINEGFKVFHFTGSEVVSDPIKIATEVLDSIKADIN